MSEKWLWLPDDERIIHQGESLELSTLSWQLFHLFNDSPDTIHSIEDIKSKLWSDKHVVDNVVYQGIRNLRVELKDTDKANQLIVNIPRKGYSLNRKKLTTEKSTATKKFNVNRKAGIWIFLLIISTSILLTHLFQQNECLNNLCIDDKTLLHSQHPMKPKVEHLKATLGSSIKLETPLTLTILQLDKTENLIISITSPIDASTKYLSTVNLKRIDTQALITHIQDSIFSTHISNDTPHNLPVLLYSEEKIQSLFSMYWSNQDKFNREMKKLKEKHFNNNLNSQQALTQSHFLKLLLAFYEFHEASDNELRNSINFFIKHYPDNHFTYIAISLFFAKYDQYQQSIKELQKTHDDALSLFLHGMYLKHLKEFESAHNKFKLAFEARPEFEDNTLMLIDSTQTQDKSSKLLAHMANEIKNLNYEQNLAHVYLAANLIQTSQLADALQFMGSKTLLYSCKPMTLANLAFANLKARDFNMYRHWKNQLEEHWYQLVAGHSLDYRLAVLTGNFSEFIDQIEQDIEKSSTIEQDPDGPFLSMYYLSSAAVEAHEYSKAREYLWNLDNLQIHDKRSEALFRAQVELYKAKLLKLNSSPYENSLKKAMFYISSLTAGELNSANGHFLLAQYYLLMKDLNETLLHLNKATKQSSFYALTWSKHLIFKNVKATPHLSSNRKAHLKSIESIKSVLAQINETYSKNCSKE
ncbi:winged helix-turn-helix domain-containing protein [Pleionea sp. CnH1-48]|uniref:winged helix-turn-helix domain-containing protein n=1 Tax=Pleionea sp. CnH1-48 TaxID=2954494 RepID=UPI0020977B3E|nr:winged helix-turn-helix domain-containing protein [Pleionea sp. CnH1-48]MCO7223545.1 winged helix-turn-helix domain-containing protein [Pleionea sp. CnH1-48]